jgi:hypothetical protein
MHEHCAREERAGASGKTASIWHASLLSGIRGVGVEGFHQNAEWPDGNRELERRKHTAD